jgi:hypothetical protein
MNSVEIQANWKTIENIFGFIDPLDQPLQCPGAAPQRSRWGYSNIAPVISIGAVKT